MYTEQPSLSLLKTVIKMLMSIFYLGNSKNNNFTRGESLLLKA